MESKILKRDDEIVVDVDETPLVHFNMNFNPLNAEDTLTPTLQFLQFDGSFLKSVRLVSKLWNQVALKQFLKFNFLRIPPNFNSGFPSQDEKDAALTEKEKVLKPVGTIQNISFSDDYLNEMKMFSALPQSIQWEKTTQIRINFQFQANESIEKIMGNVKFLEEIMIQCPHLKFLDIPQQPDHLFSRQAGLSLMKLCGDLKKNEHFTISNLAANLSNQRTAKLISSFSETGVRILNFLAKPMHQLKNDCPLEIPSIIKAFQKIMESNKNHLISLGLNDRAEIFLPGFQIPKKIPQLETLHLAADRMSQLQFQDGFQFHENFPNLREVNFKLNGTNWPGRNHFWTNIFQNQQPCHNVKKLKVTSVDKIDEEIFQVFPEIEELIFCGRVIVTSPSIFQILQRNCKKLRILRLEAPINLFGWSQLRFVSQVSGFSSQVVRTLMAEMKLNREIEDMSRFPRTEAFEILKNLEELEFICNDDAGNWSFCEKFMKFLQEYVFSTMPKLRVKRGGK